VRPIISSQHHRPPNCLVSGHESDLLLVSSSHSASICVRFESSRLSAIWIIAVPHLPGTHRVDGDMRVRTGLARRRCRLGAGPGGTGPGLCGAAPVVLVFLANPSGSAAKYGRRGETLYAVQDATIACAYAQLGARNAGLGSCWVGAFRERQVRAALGVGHELRPVALLPIGYSAELPEITSRRPLSEMVLDQPV
jgi:hypothetical protein